MARYGMLIDTTKCIGCYACRIACQDQNHLPADVSLIKFHEFERGAQPCVSVETVPTQCMHCEDAPCQSVCPTGATFTDPDGIVRADPERCIGCKYCMAACPYQARVVDHRTGVVDKCRFCTLYAPLEEGMSTCLTACPAGVRMFGDLDDPESEVSKRIVETNAQPIAGDLTKSKIFYVR